MRYFPAAMICLTISLPCPHSVTAQQMAYTRRSLRAAMQSARTASDYATLAHYFHEQSIWYKERADEQERVLRQEMEHPSPSSKYPAAEASARRFHEYYAEQARQATELSNKYAAREHAAQEPGAKPTVSK